MNAFGPRQAKPHCVLPKRLQSKKNLIKPLEDALADADKPCDDYWFDLYSCIHVMREGLKYGIDPGILRRLLDQPDQQTIDELSLLIMERLAETEKGNCRTRADGHSRLAGQLSHGGCA